MTRTCQVPAPPPHLERSGRPQSAPRWQRAALEPLLARIAPSEHLSPVAPAPEAPEAPAAAGGFADTSESSEAELKGEQGEAELKGETAVDGRQAPRMPRPLTARSGSKFCEF